MKKLNFYVTDTERKVLKQQSEKTGASVSILIRRAIDNTYGKKPKKQK